MDTITDPQTILAAGAYGTALLFFAYGAYALLKTRNAEQNKNVRWYLGIGAIVVVAMIGFDTLKSWRSGERVVPNVYLTFSPRFAAVKLPDPVIEYSGQTLAPNAPIRVADNNSSINISVDSIIETVKGLQQNNQQLQSALGSAALASQPRELAEEIAAASSAGKDPCEGGDATLCGWKQLSNGQLANAQQTLTQAVKDAPADDPKARATALSGLGEIYVGQGRLDEARIVLKKAADLGNSGAKKRLDTLAVPSRTAPVRPLTPVRTPTGVTPREGRAVPTH
ncbi:tetratricopeptide repeat protein [Lysobacter capsici]|uniref:tetratricopeptide repeat protein n=1 Tax=Lysobacter capsici TaxID=435897 RepID=UPI00287B6161|nr:tetratricopeptide repeat protein [Lysobacter capsici]WND81230.1 tetratricopeptide repeat protein [Lysobacter capsici]WND86426.1 tetratricopeptide repeat protein [Lysobacter capsici]